MIKYETKPKTKSSKYETKLLELIRGNEYPDRALKISIEIILGYLAQRESFEAPISVAPREQA